jgi:hypothetical protein
MKFEDLRTRMAGRPFFRPHDLHVKGMPPAHELVQLSNWTREGKLVRLKKGLYTLSRDHLHFPLASLTLAEPLYRPSYVSRYGLIPESVGAITSVTTLKTARFRNEYGEFIYKHIAPHYFFGFHREALPSPHFVASPEKAILDFIHLSIPKSEHLSPELLLDGYRLQNLGRLKKKRLAEALVRFKTPRVRQGGLMVMELLGKSHD